jgi:AraC-like DNA-binding protein
MLEETRPTGNGRARGLVSSRVSGARVEAKTFRPSREMARFVESYWVGSWDLRGQAPHTVELLGDPCLHIVAEARESRIVGVWTHTWVRTLEGVGMVRAAKLRAGAAGAFFEQPVWRFTDRIVPLGDHLPWDAAIEQSILEPAEHAAGVAQLETWLKGRVREDRPPEVELAIQLMEMIAADRSIVSVEALAEHAGLHKRILQRVFRANVGAPPKWAIRRHRLQEAAARIERGEDVGLARLAGELGYADQAHLARDFKSAVGKTPSDFARDVHR